MIAVYLIRHAQASFDSDDYDQLSTLGCEQARVLGTALRARLPRIDGVATGTLRRHRQTAEICLASLGEVPAVRQFPGLDEIDSTELLVRLDRRYQDRTEITKDLLLGGNDPHQAFQAIFDAAFDRYTSGRHDSEYRLSWPLFRRRAAATLEEILEPLSSSSPQTLLVFTSGGPITAICLGLLGIPQGEAPRIIWTLVNGGVTKLLSGPDGLVLSSLNEHAHFEGENRALITYR